MLKIPTVARIIAGLLCLALTLGFLSAPVQAEEPLPTVLIIDSSGSMAGKVPDGRIKLDAARAVVSEVLQKWPAGGQLAVVAYGHRRQSDCADIETLVEIGPVSLGQVEQALARLRARGKTPISESLRHAADLLPQSGGAVVLVSDGLETCNADPCAVAGALKAANANLFIHVVGFGLASGEDAQLTCIAENAGGRFFGADDADQLATALITVTETVAELPSLELPPAQAAPQPLPPPQPVPAQAEPSPPTPEPPPPPPAPEPLPIVRVGLIAVAGELGRIVDSPVRWTVSDAGGQTVYEGESRGLLLELPAGSYSVKAAAANALGQIEIFVTGEQGQSFEVEVPVGRLDLSLQTNKGLPPFSDVEAAGIKWSLEPLDGQGKVDVPQLARPSLLLAPGRYRIGAQLNGLTAETIADVAPDTPKAVALDFRLGTVVLEAVLEGEAEPINDATILRWRVGEGDRVQEIAGEARPRLILPEGEYPVVLTIMGGEVASMAEVRADGESVVRVVVGGGQLTLAARLGTESPPLEDWRDTYWTVTPVGGEAGGKTVELPVANPVVPLPPGRWRVSVRSGSVTSEREVDVGPGTRIPLTLDLNAARLTVRASPESGAPAANVVFSYFAVDESDASAEVPAYEGGASQETSTIVQAGRWRVVAVDSDGRRGDAEIRLVAGDERVLEIALR